MVESRYRRFFRALSESIRSAYERKPSPTEAQRVVEERQALYTELAVLDRIKGIYQRQRTQPPVSGAGAEPVPVMRMQISSEYAKEVQRALDDSEVPNSPSEIREGDKVVAVVFEITQENVPRVGEALDAYEQKTRRSLDHLIEVGRRLGLPKEEKEEKNQ